MDKRSNAPLVFGLAAAAGGAALLLTRKAKADVTPPDDKDDTKPTVHKTIGAPYSPGFANEARNVLLACKRKDKRHPRGLSRGSTQNLADWLANVVLYETYPEAPTVIPSATSPWAKVWIRLRKGVRRCLKKADTSDPGKDPPGTDPPGTGTKMPDRAAEIRNSKIVVKVKPRTFPRNKPPYDKQRANQADDAWFSNVVLWQTYPESPRKLSTKTASHRPFVDAWKRIFELVKFEIIKAKQGTDDGGDATPGDVPKTATPGKSDIAGAAEMRNAAIVAIEKPTTFERNSAPYNVWKGSDPKQTFADWLANVAFWTTYPTAAVKLSSSAKDKPYVAAWLRIRGHVKRALAKAQTLGAPPAKGLSDRAWKKWGAMMAISSGLRSDAAIRDAYKKAVAYLNAAGAKVSVRDIGKKAGPQKVSLSGILAEAAIRVPGGQLSELPNWIHKPSRAFWVTNTMF